MTFISSCSLDGGTVWCCPVDGAVTPFVAGPRVFLCGCPMCTWREHVFPTERGVLCAHEVLTCQGISACPPPSPQPERNLREALTRGFAPPLAGLGAHDSAASPVWGLVALEGGCHPTVC